MNKHRIERLLENTFRKLNEDETITHREIMDAVLNQKAITYREVEIGQNEDIQIMIPQKIEGDQIWGISPENDEPLMTNIENILAINDSIDEALKISFDKLKKTNPADIAKVAKTTDVIINETNNSDILPPEQVTAGMIAINDETETEGKVITIDKIGNWQSLRQYDSAKVLPDPDDLDEVEWFHNRYNPNDYFVAIDLWGDSIIAYYGPNDPWGDSIIAYYVPKDGNNKDSDNRIGYRAPNDSSPTRSSTDTNYGQTVNEDDDWEDDYNALASQSYADSDYDPKEQFPTATPEQQAAIYDLQNWAVEIDLELSKGEETVGDIVKFGFQGAEGWVTILINPNGDIKISGHMIKNFNDFQDMVTFFLD